MLLRVGPDLGSRRACWPATEASTKVEPYKDAKGSGDWYYFATALKSPTTFAFWTKTMRVWAPALALRLPA